MKKNILIISLCVIMFFAVLIGIVPAFTKSYKKPVEKTTTKPAETTQYYISNENIEIFNYNELTYKKYENKTTKDDVDKYIEYIMNYNAETGEQTSTYKLSDLTNGMVKILSHNEYKTIKAYRKYIKSVIDEHEYEAFIDDTKESLFNQVLNKAILKKYDHNKLQEYCNTLQGYHLRLAKAADLSIEQFYIQKLNIPDGNEYIKYLNSTALLNLKKDYLIDAICNKELINVTDKDINDRINYYINKYEYKTKEDVLNDKTQDEIIKDIKTDKIKDILFKNASIIN